MKCTSSPRLTVLLAFSIGCLMVCLPAMADDAAEKPSKLSSADPRPMAERPHLGMSVRDHPDVEEGTVVSWIMPGPLGGDGFTSEIGIRRGDLLLSVDGQQVMADDFKDVIKARAAGETIALRIRHTEMENLSAVPKPGQGTEEKVYEVTLGSAARWRGPMDWPRDVERGWQWDDLPTTEEPVGLETMLRPLMAEYEHEEPVEKLLAFWQEELDSRTSPQMLSRVAYVYVHPFRLPELERAITQPLAKVANQPGDVFGYAAENLDLALPSLNSRDAEEAERAEDAEAQATAKVDADLLGDPAAALGALADDADAAAGQLSAAFGGMSLAERGELLQQLDQFMVDLPRSVYLFSHEDPEASIALINSTLEVDWAGVVGSGRAFGRWLVVSRSLDAADLAAGFEQAEEAAVPEAIREAVEGPILAAIERDGQWYVFGGAADNVYDMGQLAGVIDVGGDDEYVYSAHAAHWTRAIIDLAGDDLHHPQGDGDDRTAGGPAAGWAGLSLLVDHHGNDEYHSRLGGIASGIFGLGLLVDHQGGDRYEGDVWSTATAFYGLGAVIDRHGNDAYESHQYSQAVGGPVGMGLILDRHGYDLYRQNGPVRSAYGDDAIYRAVGQAMGFALRGYTNGGLGILYDQGGHDRYDAGEFSQGGGYAGGLGILNDRRGNDRYTGERYSQGFGCHQAHGILADDAGNDLYVARTAANHGGSWDMAVGMLIDRAGDDVYHCGGLSMGGASMQAIGILLDLNGVDHRTGGSLGESRGNSYHYNRSGAMSYSVFLDAGGDADHYAGGKRENNTTLAPGAFNEEVPENSSLHGVFIDTEQEVEW